MLNQCPAGIDFDVYQPRNPKASAYYRCVEDHFEQLEAVWDERYQRSFGFWRPYVADVIHRYLDCGDLHFGFARVKCEDCGHEYLLAFSCKRRHFCPSCHQKRVVEFGEWLCEEVLKYVPHRQWVFSIPKPLPQRRYQMKKCLIFIAVVVAMLMVVQPQPVSAKNFKLKFEACWPTGSSLYGNFTQLAARIKEMSGGRLEIETLPAGAVVPAFEILDAVSRGCSTGVIPGLPTGWASRKPRFLCPEAPEAPSAWTNGIISDGCMRAAASNCIMNFIRRN